MCLDVTVIAPEVAGYAPLAFAREIGALNAVEGVRLQIITGPDATLDKIARALRTRADLVIWSGHGKPGGLLTPDGLVDGEWLATQARKGAPRVMVLAACGSRECEALSSLVSAVSRVGINVIGMPMAAEDDSAIQFNKEFLRALVAGADVYDAHRVATKRVALMNPQMADGIELIPGLTNGYRAIVDRIEAQDGRLLAIESELRSIRELLERKRR